MQLVSPLEMMKLENTADQSGVTYDQMMENAGKGLAEHLVRIAVTAVQSDGLPDRRRTENAHRIREV